MTIDTAMLPCGYLLEQDADGDWILFPPRDVTLVSVPGEGLLIGTCDAATAMQDALAVIAGDQP